MTDVNFILIENPKKTIPNANFKTFLIFLHFFFYWQHHERRKCLTYTYTPLYAHFKKSWCKSIGKYYYLTLLVLPVLLFTRLLLSYHSSILWWFCAVLIIPWFVVALVNFIYDCSCKIRIKLYIRNITNQESIIMLFGNPGAGKTSSAIFRIKVLADLMWEEIQLKYKLLEPYLEQVPFFKKLERERAEEIIEAYNYYKNSKTYPCLATSIPVFVDGVPANRLEDVHLMQDERMAYGMCGIIDESKSILPPELHRTNPDEIVNMAKLPRHLGNFHFILTDQAKEGAFNAWRRCTAETIFMEKQKWVLKPRFLIWLKDKITLSMKHPTKTKVVFLKVLGKITSCIGYRKYYYSSFGNEYKQYEGRTKTFILPPFLNAEYDDRSFRQAYKCLGKPLTVKKWESMELTPEQVQNIFSQKIRELSKSKKTRKTKEGDNNGSS